jgi:VWFA-related protein
MKRSDVLPSVFLCLLAAGPAAAQQPPTEPPAPIFGETVEVRVVNLEVVVTDRDGLPVTGLGPDDFRLSVDGAETPIRYFTEVRAGTAVATEAPAAREITSLPDLVPGEPVGTSYLVFVDDFFAVARDRDRVLAALRDDLARLKPEDRMAIVAFDGEKLTMLTTWSSSARDLERALRDATARPAKGLQRLAERRNFRSGLRSARPTGRLRTSLDFDERFYAELLEDQVSNMVSAAAAALRSFANPPGRKVLLLLNGGWPYEIDEFVANEFARFVVDPGIQDGRRLYAPLIDTANQVGYTVFPVDVPGIGEVGTASADSFRIPSDEDSAELRSSQFLREHNVQFALERVAGETGGRALLNAERLEALPMAEAATRTYYFIGFEPAWKGDDRRHDVEVTTRQEGLRVSSRDSYVDFSRKSEVSAAVESSLLLGGGPGIRPLSLQVGAPERVSLNVMRVRVRLSLPAAEVTLLPAGDGRAADLELRVAAIDERGGRTEVPVIPVRVTAPRESPAGARLDYETTIELRRTRNRLAVAVYDPAAGTLWASTVEVAPEP